MAIKFEKVKAGMTLYDRHSHRMGNTKMREIGEWPVRVLEVNEAERKVLTSWNGNPPHWQPERYLKGLYDWSMRDDCAEVVRGVWDRVIKVTKKKAPKKEAK